MTNLLNKTLKDELELDAEIRDNVRAYSRARTIEDMHYRHQILLELCDSKLRLYHTMKRVLQDSYHSTGP